MYGSRKVDIFWRGTPPNKSGLRRDEQHCSCQHSIFLFPWFFLGDPAIVKLIPSWRRGVNPSVFFFLLEGGACFFLGDQGGRGRRHHRHRGPERHHHRRILVDWSSGRFSGGGRPGSCQKGLGFGRRGDPCFCGRPRPRKTRTHFHGWKNVHFHDGWRGRVSVDTGSAF